MVDRQGCSELHYGALEGTAEQARALLAAGQDPDLGDRDGFTSLHLAAQQGNLEVAAVLLEAGAQVDPVNKYGNAPLFVAVSIRRAAARSSNCCGGMVRIRIR